MAYKNFIPSVWAEGIQRELDKRMVFKEDCNLEYEGEVKDVGDSVTIIGVGKPTIYTGSTSVANANINDPETIEDTSAKLIVNRFSYFNYLVDDIDKRQASGQLEKTLQTESSEEMADTIDKYIGSFAADPNVKKLFDSAKKVVATETEASTAGNAYVLDIIDEAVELLQKNNVKTDQTKIVTTVSRAFYRRFKKAYRLEETNNSAILKNGLVGKYGNVFIKLSNNVYNDGTNDHIMIRTQRAIGFVQQFTKIEAYRPEKRFSDAVKGCTVYGGKVVRPKEMIDINVKYV